MAYAKGKSPKTKEQEKAEVKLMCMRQTYQLAQNCLISACQGGIPATEEARKKMVSDAYDLARAFVAESFGEQNATVE